MAAPDARHGDQPQRAAPMGQASGPVLPEAAQQRLRRPMRLTWAGLWFERIAQGFWPLATLVMVLVTLLGFSLQDLLPPDWLRPARWATGALFALTLGHGLWHLVRHWPHAREAWTRLDGSLPGQPIAALGDQQAIGRDDPASAKVWARHQARMLASLHDIRPVPPAPNLAARDPLALRHVALTGAVMAALFGSGSLLAPGGISPGAATAMATGPTWEGWARPPAYTGKPTLYLPDLQSDALALPQGSRIQIRLYGAPGSLEISQSLQPTRPDAAPAPTDKPTAMTEIEVMQSGRLEIAGAHGRSFEITLLPDAAPTIAPDGEISRDADGRFRQGFTASDDHGVVAGTVSITLDLDQVPRHHGLAMEPEPIAPVALDLPMPMRGKRDAIKERLVDDLSKTIFANMPVVMTFRAEDAAGQQGEAAPLHTVLPARRFFDPMAAAVAEMRRDLMWNRAQLDRVSEILKAVSARPEGLSRGTKALRRLRVSLREIDAMPRPLSDAARDGLAEELWQIALSFEEGELASARERLERAQDRLEEAIRRGASPEETRRLMQEMQQAMRDWMRELGKQAETQGQAPQAGESREITRDQLQQMLDEIEQLMQEGRTAEALERMEMLRQLMENLQVQQGQGGEGEPGEGQGGGGQGGMRELGETLRDQQELSDDAWRGLQQDRRGAGQPGRPGERTEGQGNQAGEGQENEGGGGAADPDRLAERQRELRERLRDLQDGQLPGDGREEGEAGRDALDGADKAMREAEEALRDGDLSGALDRQARAMEQMREGLRQLGRAEALEGNARDPDQEGGDRSGRSDPRNRDPLGRSPDEGARLGGDQNMLEESPDRRAADLLEELRRRSGEAERPAPERDYLRRLLDLF